MSDPRSKHGTSHPFTTALAVVLLGLLANRSTLAEIQRWAEIHFPQLRQFLEFKDKKGRRKVPHAITFARILRKLSLDDLQNAFADRISGIQLNGIFDDMPIAAAIDGKVAKQMKDSSGDPILMLNVFAQNVKVHLASWSIRGDKTNEPGCLKQHLGELFAMYPCLKLLTGDAIYAQRPLLEAIQEYHRDYLVQIKDNQEKTHQQMKLIFEDAPQQPPSDVKVAKPYGPRRELCCHSPSVVEKVGRSLWSNTASVKSSACVNLAFSGTSPPFFHSTYTYRVQGQAFFRKSFQNIENSSSDR